MPEVARITGIQDVQRMLAEAPRVVVATGYLRAMEAAVQVIEEELYIHTPERSEGERNEETVHLRDAITHQIVLDSQYRGAYGAVGFGKLGNVAMWLEYGHRIVGHRPGHKYLGQAPPHPFMRRAFDGCADRATAAFADSLESTLTTANVLKQRNLLT